MAALKLTPARLGIILLTLSTAVIHIALAQPLFILNGLGYLALLAAYLLPQPVFARRRTLIRYAFIAYTVLTIVLYFVVHANGSWQQDGLGVATKLAEIILVLLLLLDGQQASG
jgi:hypothetical protein